MVSPTLYSWIVVRLKGKSEPETIDFPIQSIGFLYFLPFFSVLEPIPLIIPSGSRLRHLSGGVETQRKSPPSPGEKGGFCPRTGQRTHEFSLWIDGFLPKNLASLGGELPTDRKWVVTTLVISMGFLWGNVHL